MLTGCGGTDSADDNQPVTSMFAGRAEAARRVFADILAEHLTAPDQPTTQWTEQVTVEIYNPDIGNRDVQITEMAFLHDEFLATWVAVIENPHDDCTLASGWGTSVWFDVDILDVDGGLIETTSAGVMLYPGFNVMAGWFSREGAAHLRLSPNDMDRIACHPATSPRLTHSDLELVNDFSWTDVHVTVTSPLEVDAFGDVVVLAYSSAGEIIDVGFRFMEFPAGEEVVAEVMMATLLPDDVELWVAIDVGNTRLADLSGGEPDEPIPGGNEFSAFVRQGFLAGCLAEEGATEEYCECSLREIEATFTEEEFTAMSLAMLTDDVSDEDMERLTAAALRCLSYVFAPPTPGATTPPNADAGDVEYALLGTWEFVQTSTWTYEFYADGTGNRTRWEAVRDFGTDRETFTWSVDGDLLNIHRDTAPPLTIRQEEWTWSIRSDGTLRLESRQGIGSYTYRRPAGVDQPTT